VTAEGVPPGASVRDVAARAGVSVGTVSNVLNRPEKVAPDTVARVQDAIDRLGFVRNDVARQLRVGRSRSIGLVVLDATNPFFTDLARGAEDRAALDGLVVLVGNSDDRAERESGYLDLFEEQRVRGVLISPVGDAADRLLRLRRRGISAVLVDRPAEGGDLPSVTVDDVAGGRMAIAHLIESGRRRIAFVGGPLAIRQVADRLTGATDEVRRHPGVELEVILADALTVADGHAVGEALAGRPPESRPDAVFAANDLLAIGAMQALVVRAGASIPADIAMIGYDDIAYSATTIVPLSSIRQPSHAIGYRAVDLLLGGVVENVVFQPELVVRESTALR
jgi:LacI family transcriptional regulator